MIRAFVVVAALALLPSGVAAHQPVMDMAPRWADGYGFQVRHTYRSSDERIDGSSDASNPLRRTTRVRTTWLEGVYTFRRERRVTFKLPWVDQKQLSSTGVHRSGRGLGDVVLGVPLKEYFNLPERTGNFGLTPSVRLPTGSTSDDWPVGDGSWDAGLSLSYSTETSRYYLLADLFYWLNGAGRRSINDGDQLGFDLNLGIHPVHDAATTSGVFLMLNGEARWQAGGHNTTGPSGGKRLSLGPVVVLYRRNFMLRLESVHPVYEDARREQFARGIQYRIGAGITF